MIYKKYSFIVFLFSFVSGFLFSQPDTTLYPIWEVDAGYGGSGGAMSIKRDRVYSVGTTWNGTVDGYLFVCDTAGEKQWDFTYATLGNNGVSLPIFTEDSTMVLVCGGTDLVNGNVPTSYLTKRDYDGNEIWGKYYMDSLGVQTYRIGTCVYDSTREELLCTFQKRNLETSDPTDQLSGLGIINALTGELQRIHMDFEIGAERINIRQLFLNGEKVYGLGKLSPSHYLYTGIYDRTDGMENYLISNKPRSPLFVHHISSHKDFYTVEFDSTIRQFVRQDYKMDTLQTYSMAFLSNKTLYNIRQLYMDNGEVFYQIPEETSPNNYTTHIGKFNPDGEMDWSIQLPYLMALDYLLTPFEEGYIGISRLAFFDTLNHYYEPYLFQVAANGGRVLGWRLDHDGLQNVANYFLPVENDEVYITGIKDKFPDPNIFFVSKFDVPFYHPNSSTDFDESVQWDVRIYPNPANDNTRLIIKNVKQEKNQQLRIQVHSGDGHLFVEKEGTLKDGSCVVGMQELTRLPSGLYWVTIYGDGWVYSLKVVH